MLKYGVHHIGSKQSHSLNDGLHEHLESQRTPNRSFVLPPPAPRDPYRPLGSCKRTCFSDRFSLGGPLSLRGFQHYGVGPRAPREEGGCAEGDALGGDIKYTGEGR